MKDKTVKQREAAERNAKWEKLTPEQKLAHLDAHQLRAKKQRNKLALRSALGG